MYICMYIHIHINMEKYIHMSKVVIFQSPSQSGCAQVSGRFRV